MTVAHPFSKYRLPQLAESANVKFIKFNRKRTSLGATKISSKLPPLTVLRFSKGQLLSGLSMVFLVYYSSGPAITISVYPASGFVLSPNIPNANVFQRDI